MKSLLHKLGSKESIIYPILWIASFVFEQCQASFGGGHPPASGDWIDYSTVTSSTAYWNNMSLPTDYPNQAMKSDISQAMALTAYYNTFLLKCISNGMVGYLTASSIGDNSFLGPLSTRYNDPKGDSQLFFKTADERFVNILNPSVQYSSSHVPGSNNYTQHVKLMSSTNEYLQYDPTVNGSIRIVPDVLEGDQSATWIVVPFPPPEYKIGAYYIQSKVNYTDNGNALYLTLANKNVIGRTHLNTSSLIIDRNMESLQLFRVIHDQANAGKWVGISPILAPDFKLDYLNWGNNGDISIITWPGGRYTNSTVQVNQRWNVDIPMRGEWGQMIVWPGSEKYLFCMGNRTEVIANNLVNAPTILDADLWRFIPYPLSQAPFIPPIPNISCTDDCPSDQCF